ncbi:MAG: hypothetical protein PHD88_00770 [Firmicutes bacterium]|nr:hypothetical protein [Bacillota bacterium]MDD4692927.1 hypothetical protein [Bacillota bacterium]
MYFSSHLSCGLLLGALTKSSVGAFGLGLVSHAALDMVPHHDYRSVGGAAIDLVTGLTILSTIRTLFADISGPLFWGAVGATIPDLEVALRHVLPRYNFKALFPSHSGALPHPQRKFPRGVFVQVVLTTVCLFLTCYFGVVC